MLSLIAFMTAAARPKASTMLSILAKPMVRAQLSVASNGSSTAAHGKASAKYYGKAPSHWLTGIWHPTDVAAVAHEKVDSLPSGRQVAHHSPRF